MDLSYRSNNYDVRSLKTCSAIIDMFNYKLVDRLYKNKKHLDEALVFDKINVNVKFVGKGGQGKVYLVKSLTDQESCGYIVVKVIKNCREMLNELEIIPHCKEVIEKFISPNFLYYYGIKKQGPYNLITSEYADGSLENWLKISHTYQEWRSFLFQFLMGVLCIQIVLKGYHSDLKPKNIFYKNLANDKLLFGYDIFGEKYVVPTMGYLYMLADFGSIQSLLFKHNKLNENSIKLYIKNNVDLEHIIDLHKRIIVNAIEKIYSFDALIEIIKLKNDKFFEGYLKNKKIELAKQLAKYPEPIKKKMLFRSVAYYVVEKNYIDPYKLPDNLMIMKLPPKEIITQIQDWTKAKSITDILNTFSEYKIKDFTDSDDIVKFSLV